jgi:6-phosphogluconolactonase
LHARGTEFESCSRATGPLWAYFGTYKEQESVGIYVARLDPISGALGKPARAAVLSNPSFLCDHPAHTHLFAVSEVSDFAGERSGAVSAFAIDRSNGALRLLDQQGWGGAGPCHISIDRKGRNVLVANYGSGSVARFVHGMPLGHGSNPSAGVTQAPSYPNPNPTAIPSTAC